MSNQIPRDRPTGVEITDEMIREGETVFDLSLGSLSQKELVRAVYIAMVLASRRERGEEREHPPA